MHLIVCEVSCGNIWGNTPHEKLFEVLFPHTFSMEHAWCRHGGGVEEPQIARKRPKIAKLCSLYLTIGVQWGNRYGIAGCQACLNMF